MRLIPKIIKFITPVMVLLAFSGHALAQNAVHSVGSLTRSETGDFEVHIKFDQTVGADAADIGKYSLSQGTISSASRVMDLAPADGWKGDATIPAGSPTGREGDLAREVNAPPESEVRPVDNSVVALVVTGLEPGTEATLTVSGIAGVEDSSHTFTASPFTYTRVGARRDGGQLGNAIAVGDDGFDVFSSGATQWANYDETDLVWVPLDGEFDIQARVVFQDYSSQWARAGIMAREALDEGKAAPEPANALEDDPAGFSRYVTAHVNPVHDFNGDGTIGTGNNGWESNHRSAGVGHATAGNGAATDPSLEYPNAYVRLVRSGDSISAFRSNNGVDWVQIGAAREFPGLASPIHVGPSYSAETANAEGFLAGKTTLAMVREVSWTVTPFAPVQISQQPQSQTVSENDIVSFSVVASGGAPRYQWFKDGNPVDGATMASYSIRGVKMADAGSYTVNVVNPSGVGETSEAAVLTVLPDTTPASVLHAINIDPGQIVVSFSEPIDASTGSTAGNYRIAGGSGTISGAALDTNDSTKVILSASGLVDGQVPNLVISNVNDTAGNTIPANTEVPFQVQQEFFFGDEIGTSSGKTPVVLPTDLRTDSGTGQTRGFTVKTVWGGAIPGTPGSFPVPGSIADAEAILADDSIVNQASPAVSTVDVIAFEQSGAGSIFSTGDLRSGYPGMPLQDSDGFAVEVITYLDLKVGVYSFGHNSDDGWRVTLGKWPHSGAFEVGADDRGQGYDSDIVANNYYNFIVTEPGLYPFRLVHWEGVGGAALEWTTPDPSSPTFESLFNVNENIGRAFATRQNVDGVDNQPEPEPEPEPTGPTIVWVSFHSADDSPAADAATAGFTDAPDVGYTDFLKANGYNVRRVVSSNSPDPADFANADLVIISRSVPSGDYSNDAATAWNNIDAKVMILGGYVLRNSRMGFTTGGTMIDTTMDISLAVNMPNHPIFDGISFDASGNTGPFTTVVEYNGTLQRGVSVNNNPLGGQGRLIATSGTSGDPTFGGPVIAEWSAGDSLTHAGGAGTDDLAGRRLVFLTGSREQGITSQGAGIYDLLPEGEAMFLNAIDYMINGEEYIPSPGAVLSIEDMGDGNVSISYTGGNLQMATSVTGPWVNVSGASSPYTAAATGAGTFYRTIDGANVVLNGGNARPNPIDTSATGSGNVSLDGDQLTINVSFAGLSGDHTAAHIHGPAGVEETAGVLINLSSILTLGADNRSGTFNGTLTASAELIEALTSGQAYINIHSTTNPSGEIRGQLSL